MYSIDPEKSKKNNSDMKGEILINKTADSIFTSWVLQVSHYKNI